MVPRDVWFRVGAAVRLLRKGVDLSGKIGRRRSGWSRRARVDWLLIHL